MHLYSLLKLCVFPPPSFISVTALSVNFTSIIVIAIASLTCCRSVFRHCRRVSLTGSTGAAHRIERGRPASVLLDSTYQTPREGMDMQFRICGIVVVYYTSYETNVHRSWECSRTCRTIYYRGKGAKVSTVA